MEWIGDSSSQTQEIIKFLGSMEKCQRDSTAFLHIRTCALVTGDLDEHRTTDIPLQPQEQGWGNISVELMLSDSTKAGPSG